MVISLSQGNKILQDLQEYCPTIGLKSIILFNYSCQFALTDVLRYHVGFVLTINFCLNYIINFLYSNLSNMNNSKFVVDNIDYHQFIKQLQIIDLQWFHCFHPYCVLLILYTIIWIIIGLHLSKWCLPFYRSWWPGQETERGRLHQAWGLPGGGLGDVWILGLQFPVSWERYICHGFHHATPCTIWTVMVCHTAGSFNR